mmetsp:Transcript_24578/g.21816  ORF Transcript_24578/g.21816 Transcript_24578/m.21816 type:complete len:86 (+) Transcript_24578:194-451(+)
MSKQHAEKAYSRFIERTKPKTMRESYSPTSKMITQFEKYTDDFGHPLPCKKSVKIQKRIQSLVKVCKNGMEVFPNSTTAIDYGNF